MLPVLDDMRDFMDDQSARKFRSSVEPLQKRGRDEHERSDRNPLNPQNSDDNPGDSAGREPDVRKLERRIAERLTEEIGDQPL